MLIKNLNGLLGFMLLIPLLYLSACSGNPNKMNPVSVKNSNRSMNDSNTKRDTATFAGGCFWCIETTMARLKGVDTVISGYTGGHVKNPSYKEVCTGTTGHAEAVQIIYDPAVIDYNTLLTVFFTMHDPTTLNRQGHDIGTQYRSAIFYGDQAQKDSAEAFISKLTKDEVFSSPIVTELKPLGVFYNAEDYHQNYYNLNREQNSYCTAVIDPKVSKLRKTFSHLLKD